MGTGLESKTDNEVIEELKEAVRLERVSTARVLRALIEFDRRAIIRRRAYPSLFEYVTSTLGYSEQAAYKRIQAAKAADICPEILELLERRKINLSRIVTIRPHLTSENSKELIERAVAMKQRDLEFYVAGLAPKPVPRDVTRELPMTGPLPHAVDAQVVQQRQAAAPAPVERAVHVHVLTETLARVHFTADKQTLADLDRACKLLRCAKSNSGVVIARALKLLLAKIDPDVKIAGNRSVKPRPCDPDSRRIPQHVRDVVWKRDGGRCAFIDETGQRCRAAGGLDFDHVVPWAAGGRSDDPDGIRLLCPLHNQAAARQWFGDDHIDQAISLRRERRRAAPGRELSGHG